MGEEAKNRVFKPIEKTAKEHNDRPHVHADAQLKRRKQRLTAQRMKK